MRDSLTSVKIFSSVKSKLQSDDESEVEEDVKQQIREHGRLDIWHQDDANYYSSLMPNRRLGVKEEPLAIMPAADQGLSSQVARKEGLHISHPSTSAMPLVNKHDSSL